MKFYCELYGTDPNKIIIEAVNASKAMKKIFKLFPEHKESEGEDIAYILSENEVENKEEFVEIN